MVELTDGANGGGTLQFRRPHLLAGRATWLGNDRSSRRRPRRPTCGITASGDTFRFVGYACWMVRHSTISENPAWIWYFISSSMRFRASGVRALVWGPRWMAAQIAASDHGSPHRAETPDAHCSSVATNGWNRIQGAGSVHFLLLPWASLCGDAIGIVVRLAGSGLARSKNCTFRVSFRVIARVACTECAACACAHEERSLRTCARRMRLERSMRRYRPCVGRVLRRAQLVGRRRVGIGRGLSRDSRVARTQRIR